jgi:hypothetical protein
LGVHKAPILAAAKAALHPIAKILNAELAENTGKGRLQQIRCVLGDRGV